MSYYQSSKWKLPLIWSSCWGLIDFWILLRIYIWFGYFPKAICYYDTGVKISNDIKEQYKLRPFWFIFFRDFSLCQKSLCHKMIDKYLNHRLVKMITFELNFDKMISFERNFVKWFPFTINLSKIILSEAKRWWKIQLYDHFIKTSCGIFPL